MDFLHEVDVYKDNEEAQSLVGLLTAHEGVADFSEGARRVLRAPHPGDTLLFAGDDDGPTGLGLLGHSDNFSVPHLALNVALRPDVRHGDLARRLVDALVGRARQLDPGTVVIAWPAPERREVVEALETAEFEVQRRLHRMECALPLDETPRWPAGTTVRTFVAGRDEGAWLAVNNAAFANHPEQSDWIETTLTRRMAEDWFDADGFLLAEDTDGLAGFCWTKQHPESIGEIFVIGVDPARQGTGLGRALAVAGLASLSERGSSTGMLYVDAGNEAAVALYTSLGFRVVHTDVAYARVP